MARLIEEEVWTSRPKILTLSSQLVLMRLADSAGRDHRMVWIGIQTLVDDTRCSRSTVYEALRQLRELNIVVDVPEPEWPGEARRYESVVRKINPVSEWAFCYVGGRDVVQSPEADFRTPTAETPSGNRNDLVRNPDPIQELNNQELKDIEETPSLLSIGSRRSAPKPRPKISDDDGLDPADAVFAAMQRHPAGSKLKEPGPDTGMGLAKYLATKLRASLAGRRALTMPDPINYPALAGTLNRWMRDGTEPAMIRRWMDVYVESVVETRALNAPVWKSFLASRAQLVETNLEQVDREFGNAIMNDPTSPAYLEYWSEAFGMTVEELQASMTPLDPDAS